MGVVMPTEKSKVLCPKWVSTESNSYIEDIHVIICTCRIKASDTTAKMLLDNPTYSSTLTSQPHPTVQYSSLGPRGMPTDNTIEGTAPTYDIIKNDGPPAELMGEGNYQVVRGEREGETYDVPFQRTTATPSTEDYSVLQHQ